MTDRQATRHAPAKPALGRSGLAPLWWLLALICLPEIVLMLADRGLFGSLLWRSLAYQNGAFWPGLLADWSPNYPAQPATMFVSYGLLHVGAAHMIGNAAVLIWLANGLCPQVGGWRLFALFFGSAFGAAAVYGWLSFGLQPMVGASGAIFGLAGAWLVKELRPDFAAMRQGGRASLPGWIWLGQMLALMIAINVLYWFLQDGKLAWEAHLGGGLTGAVLALIVGETRTHPA